jgi:hypothetical protein
MRDVIAEDSLLTLIKSVQITYVAHATFRELLLKIGHPLLKPPHFTPLLDPGTKLKPSTKITLDVDNVSCDSRDKSNPDLNIEMRRAFVWINQVKLLLEHGLTVWIDLVLRLKFEAKIKELSEECWSDKAAAVQALSQVTARCRQS